MFISTHPLTVCTELEQNYQLLYFGTCFLTTRWPEELQLTSQGLKGSKRDRLAQELPSRLSCLSKIPVILWVVAPRNESDDDVGTNARLNKFPKRD